MNDTAGTSKLPLTSDIIDTPTQILAIALKLPSSFIRGERRENTGQGDSDMVVIVCVFLMHRRVSVLIPNYSSIIGQTAVGKSSVSVNCGIKDVIFT
jgi:hypothetical protein